MKKLLSFLLIFLWSQASFSQTVSAEYFFGDDPGVGNGTALSTIALGNNEFEISTTLNTGSLAGVHQLSIRTFKNGTQSLVFNKTLAIISSQNGTTSLEYFFDQDPGIGNGTSFTSTSIGSGVFEMTGSLNNQGLTGIHNLYIRSFNGNNVGFTYAKQVVIIDNQASPMQVEYFFDQEPGIGNGTKASTTNLGGGVFAFQNNLSTNGLKGIHKLYIRAFNNNNIGMTYVKPVMIFDSVLQNLSLEYFFDQDPGFGQGTITNLNHMGSGIYTFQDSIDIMGVSGGLHTLCLRALASNVKGHTYTKFIYISTEVDSVITLAYYFDHPPSYGNAQTVTLQEISDNIFEFNQQLSISGLQSGIHQLYIQPIKPAKGFMQQFPVFIVGEGDVLTTEYFFNTDPGVGNGTSFSHVAKNRVVIIDQISLVGSGSGKLRLGYRSKAASGIWGITQWDSLCVSQQPNFLADTVCFGDSTQFVNISGNPDSSTVYFWDFTQSGVFSPNTDSILYHTFSSPGLHTVSFAAAQPDGCADTLRQAILVNPIDTTLVMDTICEGESVLGHSTTGTYFDTFISNNSCDSVVNLFLEVLQKTDSLLTIDTCEVFIWLGDTLTQSATYFDTIANAQGCDSLMTLNLTIRNATFANLTDKVCGSYTWLGNTLSQSGTYFNTIPNTQGCDSIMTLNLTINNASTNSASDTACGSYTWQGMTLTQSGTYYDTIPNIAGCDSVMTLNLTINNSTSATLTDTACGSYVLMGNTFTQSGTYLDTILNAAGCDSVVTLDLTITTGFTINTSDTICGGDSIFLGGSYVFTSGVYSDTLQTLHGCDSIIVTDLNVTQPFSIKVDTLNNTWCNQVSFLVSSTQSGLTYYWSDNTVGDQTEVSLEGGFNQNLTVYGISSNGCLSNTSTVNFNAPDFIESYTLLANNFIRMKPGNKVLNGGVGVRNPNGRIAIDNNSGPRGTHGFVKADSIKVANNSDYDTLVFGAAAVVLPFHNTSTVIPRNFDTIYAQVGAIKDEYRKNFHVVAQKNSTVTLNNKRYGDITVNRGATVIFNNANVEITNLYVKDAATKTSRAKVIFNQATNLRVRNRVELGKRATLNPDSQMVTIYIGGGIQERHFKFRPKGVDSYANIYVENGIIKSIPTFFTSRTNLTGRFIADTILAYERSVRWNWSECLMQQTPIAPLATYSVNKVSDNDELNEEIPIVTELKVGSTTLQLSPNPTRGNFMLNLITTEVSTNRLEITITSQNGGLVMRKVYNTFNGNYQEEIDMSGLSNGVYFINVMSGETLIHEKLILTR